MIEAPQFPSPADFGWTWETSSTPWKIKWMTSTPACEACRAVIKCGCAKDARDSANAKKQIGTAEHFASVVVPSEQYTYMYLTMLPCTQLV
jgi:hypothetical protein